VTFAGATGELILKDPAGFTGTISGLTGNTVASTSDQIDLTNINSASSPHLSSPPSYNPIANVTTLVVTDGTNTDTLKLAGDYTGSTWNFSPDGSGGTIVFDPPAATVAGNDGLSPQSLVSLGRAAFHASLGDLVSTSDNGAGAIAKAAGSPRPLGGPGSENIAVDNGLLGGHGSDQFVFNANFGHDIVNDFNAGIDMTHFDQPIFQVVADMLSHTVETGLDAVIPPDQSHLVTSIDGQKPLGDFIVHA